MGAHAAVGLAAMVLLGAMKGQGVWDAMILDSSTSRLMPIRHRPQLLLRWLVRYHSQAVSRGPSPLNRQVYANMLHLAT